MIVDLYLRTETEADMRDVLRAAGLITESTDEAGETVERINGAPGTDVCDLGALREQTGTETVEGEAVPVYTDLPGYHVNVTTRDSALVAQLQPLDAEPKTALVRWAGHDRIEPNPTATD